MSDLERVIEDLIAKRKLTSKKVDAKSNENIKNKDVFSNFDVIQNSELDTQKEIITHLKNAKVSHKRWMSYVQVLIRLGDVDLANAKIPVNYTLCEFGNWYYGKGQKLIDFPEFNEMEEIHKNVHDTYLQIYELYVHPIKGSLFNSKKSQLAERNKKALYLSTILDEYSKIMFDLLILLEKSILNLSNDELLKLK